MDGQTFVLLEAIGVWNDICLKHLPRSRLIRQKDSEDLEELINFSSIPAFVTNFTLESEFSKNRVKIPFLDDEVEMTFFALC